jgi:hypothetical protein
MTRSRARVLTLALLTATAPLALPRAARAQAGDPQQPHDQQQMIAKIVDLNREAIAQYQRKHFDNARKVLRQALELCDSSGLDHHPVAARTHIHLGIVIAAGYGQRDIATKQFSEALAIQPDIALTPGLETPAAQDAFDEAAVAAAPRASTPPATAADAPAADAPAPANDDEVATPIQPFTGVSSDDGVPRTTRHAKAPTDDDDATDDDHGHLQFGALLGGGVGWASGMGDVNADTPVAGSFAGAKLGHLQLEAGYWLKPELMLSLQGRFQKVSGATVVEAPNGHTYQPATGATAVFAAATWSPVKGHLRPYLSGALGGGKIRHVVTLPTLHDCGAARNQTCVDTVAAGPFLAGVGGGVTYDLTDHVELVAALNTQVAAPDFTFNVDLAAGLAFRL